MLSNDFPLIFYSFIQHFIHAFIHLTNIIKFQVQLGDED